MSKEAKRKSKSASTSSMIILKKAEEIEWSRKRYSYKESEEEHLEETKEIKSS